MNTKRDDNNETEFAHYFPELEPAALAADWRRMKEQRQEHETPATPDHGPECPDCGDNTCMNEPVPSMMGYGADESLHCRSCNRNYVMNPFTGRFAPSRRTRGRRSEG